MKTLTARTLTALAVLAAAASMPACSDPPTAPGGININITNNNQNNNGQPAPGTSPSPGTPGGLSQVTVTQFGETCPSGSGPATWVQGGPPIVHVGCNAAITCNPMDAAKNHIPNPPPPDLFGLVGGDAGVVTVTISNAEPNFNRDVKGMKVGIAQFACTVAGIRSDTWSLPVQ